MSPSAARRTRPGPLALAFVLAGLPAVAIAQNALDAVNPRARLRDSNRNPQSSQKLDENARKLKEEDLPTRLEGIKGLGELNDPKATELLIGAANDPDAAVRVKAIDTLGQLRAKEATPLLLQQLVMRDTDTATKRRILASLGKIGDPRAIPTLVDLLARSDEPEVRGNAIFALGDIGDQAALPALEKVAGNDPALSGLAQTSIRKIRERPPPSVVPPALAPDRRAPGQPPGS